MNMKDTGFIALTIAKIVAAVFMGELAVRAVLQYVPTTLSTFQVGLLDAATVATFCSLALWETLARPIRDAAIAESAKFDRLMEAVPDGVIGVDQAGNIQFLNDRILSLFKYRRHALIGRPVQKLIPDWCAGTDAKYMPVDLGATSLLVMTNDQDLVGRKSDGSEVPIAINLNHIQTAQGPLIIGSIRDVSEQRIARDKLLEANSKLNNGLIELERRSEELRRLSELGELLQGCIEEQEAHTIISRVMTKQIPGTSGGLYLISASKNVLKCASSWGENGDSLEPVVTPEDCWALRRGRIHAADDHQSTIQCRHVKAQHDGYLCIPMMAQGELLGILHIYAPSSNTDKAAESWESRIDSKRVLLFAISEQIGLALANLRLRDELKQQSIRDSLTGLYNRRFMEESLDRELVRASQVGSPVSLVFIDLDHFKNFNDTFGHEGGDLVLREVGALLLKLSSGNDIACRLGGEELALILPEVGKNDAMHRADTIRQNIEELAIVLSGKPLGKVTASFGVADYPVCGADSQHLMRVADAALYNAKSQGRNCVVPADDMHASMNLQEKSADSSKRRKEKIVA